MLDTILGGALALLGGYMLWPSWERHRLPEQLARTIDAGQMYCQHVLVAYLIPSCSRKRNIKRRARGLQRHSQMGEVGH